jgi:N-acetylmuramoyl-L-alanine amidase
MGAVLTLLFALSASAASAAEATRVSVAERGDGLGYVVRLHASGPSGNLDVQQQAGRVELRVVGLTKAASFRLPDPKGPVQQVAVTQESGTLVVAMATDDSRPFVATAYRDGASSDILVGLTWADGANPFQAIIADGAGPGPDDVSQEHWKLDCVVLDAGHGGADGGTHGHGVKEKDVVLSITKKAGAYIRDRLGLRVIYTREDDRFIELHERGRIANESCGKLFVSIHANSAGLSARGQKAKGTETYFLGLHREGSAREVMQRENAVIEMESEPALYEGFTDGGLIVQALATSAYQRESQYLADLVEQEFKTRVGRQSRGVKQAGFLVLWRASMPAILIETGFLSNPSEARFLASEQGQDLIASAIFRAVRAYKEHYERGVGIVGGAGDMEIGGSGN